jgi:eukaryotic-like serine/threonine-protein kinase
LDAERYAQIRALFEQVCDLAEAEREACLAASGADAGMLASVRALLGREQSTTRHSDQPIIGLLGALASDECEPGDVLGAWTLLRRIGHGGMGSVYLAQRSDGHFEQGAAIKVLRGVPSPAALAFLARERQILAKLAHPNIARLLDGGATPQGRPYLVMEYIDGVAVDVYCQQQGLTAPAILRLVRTLCDAVGFAHQRLVVHCDLKPGNILVGSDGRPMLLDFGVARLLGRESPDAADTTRAFTPRYASPEQRDGAVVSTATDIYGLGRLLQLLLGGNAKSDDASPADASTEATPPANAELRAIIAKATAADPAQRYLSADALAQDITRHLDGQPVQAMAPTRIYRARKFLRRHWPAVATVLLLAAFTARVMVDRDRAQAAQLQALLERDRAVQAQASSRQISEFLVSVFNASNPDAGGGEIPTTRLVEQSLQRIDTELQGQPAIQAQLYATLAGVQQVLGNAEQALASFNRAIDIQRKLDDPLVLAGMLSRRALLARATFGRDVAIADAREALALTERAAAPDSTRHAAALALLGQTLSDDKQYAQGEALLLRALALQEKQDTPAADLRMTLEALGDHNRYKGDYAESARYFQRLAEVERLRKGEQSNEFYDALDSLGAVYGLMRRFDEAEATLRRALAGSRALAPDGSAPLAWRYSQLGRMLDNAGRSHDALPVYREALAIGARKMGVDSASYAVLLNNQATAQRRTGDFAAAQASYAQALPILERHWPANDATLTRISTDYGLVLLAAGKLDAAHERLSAAYRNRLTPGAEQSAPVLQSHIALAEWETRSGQPRKALSRLEAIAAATATLEPLDRAAYARQLGLAHAALNQFDTALAALQQSEQLTRETLGERDPRTWLAALDRAELLAAQPGQDAHATAAQLAAQILREVDASLVTDSPLRVRLVRLAARRG